MTTLVVATSHPRIEASTPLSTIHLQKTIDFQNVLEL